MWWSRRTCASDMFLRQVLPFFLPQCPHLQNGENIWSQLLMKRGKWADTVIYPTSQNLFLHL